MIDKTRYKLQKANGLRRTSLRGAALLVVFAAMMSLAAVGAFASSAPAGHVSSSAVNALSTGPAFDYLAGDLAESSLTLKQKRAKCKKIKNKKKRTACLKKLKKKKKKIPMCFVYKIKLVNNVPSTTKTRVFYKNKKYAFKKKKGKFVKVKGKKVRKIVNYKVFVKIRCKPSTEKKMCQKISTSGKDLWTKKRVPIRIQRGKRKRARLITVKKKINWPVLRTCPSTPACKTVTVTLKSTSYVTLDFGTFTRQGNLSGAVYGYVCPDLLIGKRNEVVLTRTDIDVASTGVFIDDVCGGRVTPAIRTAPGTKIALDTTAGNSSAIVEPNLALTAQISAIITLVIELRNDDNGCDLPYIQTGFTSGRALIPIEGKVTSVVPLTVSLTSPTQLLDVPACIAVGPPTLECSGFAIPIAILYRANIGAEVQIGP